MRIALLWMLLMILSGCTTLQWYGQAVHGQLDLMARRESIEQMIADQDTPDQLRIRLQQVLAIRVFASEQLGLPDNDSYTRYVDLQREAVVWNVIAAPEFSVQPVTWCYPLVGCLAYRGWFKQERADREARKLSEGGLDARVAPVPAYSTLGRFEDPVTSVMLRWDEAALAGLIFHELAHQVVFVPGETMFNEAYATAVERAGVARWLHHQGDKAALNAWQQQLAARQHLIKLLLATRQRLDDVYSIDLGPDILGPVKQIGFGQLRYDYQQWAEQNETDPYAGFFARSINNADLALVATYEAGVHAFDALLAEYDHDLIRFHSAVAELAEASAEERAAFLNQP
mgnify:CR=1 FL=1